MDVTFAVRSRPLLTNPNAMQLSRFRSLLLFALLTVPFFLTAQTGNFDETWKEFLVNNRVSNTSTLVRPDPRTDLDDYAKFLLMRLNNTFCQSELDKVPDLRAELAKVEKQDKETIKAIPGFVQRLDKIDERIAMSEQVARLWQTFLADRTVDRSRLRELSAAANNCEKQTLAKYSYLQAYTNLCQGEIATATSIFEKRTLQLAEKTSLRVEDVPGLAPEVANMKKLFRTLPRLDKAWENYVASGVSPGWKDDLPVYPCYPEPNIKALILRGAADACGAAPAVLTEIEALRENSGGDISEELQEQVEALEDTVADQDTALATLNAAWEAFLPANEVPRNLRFGYDYCEKLPLIRAYVMDGYAFVCETALDNLDKIKELQSSKPVKLDRVTQEKIDALSLVYQAYIDNGERIDALWEEFVEQGDTLYGEFYSSDQYCDNIQRAKDWTMRGLSGNCDSPDFYQSLEKIELLQSSFTFQFYEELECRVNKLRRRVYDCRFDILYTLAEVDEESDKPLDERVQALLDEHDMGERPELCEPE